MKCLECDKSIDILDNVHLLQCAGLTLQEYALRHNLSLDILVPHHLLNQQESVDCYSPSGSITKSAAVTLSALKVAGKVKYDDLFCYVTGEVRQLDQLFWLEQCLSPFKFQFRQEYIFNHTTHRVIALNHLKAKRKNVLAVDELVTAGWSTNEWMFFSVVLLVTSSVFYGGYVFFSVNDRNIAKQLQQVFGQHFGIQFQLLDGQDGECLLRTLTQNDATTLMNILKPKISDIPGVEQRYYLPRPHAMVAKQMTFDSAHFITDHPGKCANLHGGRYDLIVKVYDRIDPQTGFVVDYGYLKTIMQREIIDQLDHKSLNLVNPVLAWRSSTEHISLFIWERLIHYFPNLYELQIYETAQSYCCFKGPSLDELQESGGHIVPSHFQDQQLGKSQWRRKFQTNEENECLRLHAVQGDDNR